MACLRFQHPTEDNDNTDHVQLTGNNRSLLSRLQTRSQGWQWSVFTVRRNSTTTPPDFQSTHADHSQPHPPYLKKCVHTHTKHPYRLLTSALKRNALKLVAPAARQPGSYQEEEEGNPPDPLGCVLNALTGSWCDRQDRGRTPGGTPMPHTAKLVSGGEIDHC